MKRRFTAWSALLFAVILGVQGVRSVAMSLTERQIGWKLGWLGVSALCALIAYSLWRTFLVLRNSKNSN